MNLGRKLNMSTRRFYLLRNKSGKYIRSKTILLYLLYIVVANLLYPEVNSVVNYMWKLRLDFSEMKLIINTVLCLITYLSVPRKNLVPYIMFNIVLSFIYVPITVIINYTSYSIEYSFVFFASFILSVLFYKFMLKLPVLKIKRRLNEYYIEKAMILYTLFLTLYVLAKFNIAGSLVHVFTNIYSIRSEVAFAGIDGYLIKGYVALVSPILVAMGVKNKKITNIAMAFVLNLILFLTFAFKVYFLYFILVLVMTIIFEYFDRFKNYLVQLSSIGIIILTKLLGTIIYPYMDRFLYLPGLLNVLYYDFFKVNPYNYFYGSKIGVLFQIENYSRPLGFVIDSAFFGGGMNANTGYVATAYGELGLIGIFIASIMLGYVIYIIYLASNKNNLFGFSTGILYVFELMNASVFSLFLTDFFILYMVIVYFIKIDPIEQHKVWLMKKM